MKLTDGDLTSLCNAVLQDLGLGGASPLVDTSGREYFVLRSAEGYKVRLDVFFSIEMNERELHTRVDAIREIEKATAHIRASVMRSPYVSKLVADLEAAQKEVARLKPFETHYQMEYKLRQGRPLDAD